ncbi:glucose-1-phosphate cytidylyltransferase [Deltaproteobacteria bacterium]|nr:glucose-1-phosphate cytidylyltransferase [Deltaproteobacteria bacterium]
MKTIILCGGRGSRLSEETDSKPKPMVEIGNQPILWHIMKIYSHYGVKEFVLALGYKSEIIKQYFINYHYHKSDLTVNIQTGDVRHHNNHGEDWKVHLVETGRFTQTGGRIKGCMSFAGKERVMATYGDGVGNINIKKLLNFHKKHGKLATMTAVRPTARFGDLVLDGEQIVGFSEKSQTGGGWINGGFFVLEPEVAEYIEDDSMPFEAEPIVRLTREGQIMAFKHKDFWQPMDTIREKQLLEKHWSSGKAPWKIW